MILSNETIEAGQAWASRNADSDPNATLLCSFYPSFGANVLDLRQHPRDSIQWLEAAVRAARVLGSRDAEAVNLGDLGNAYFHVGEDQHTVELHEQSLKITHEIDDRHEEGTSLLSLGAAYSRLGKTRDAIKCFEESLDIAREIGDRRGESAALCNLAHEFDEPRRALKQYKQALTDCARDR